MHKKGYFLLFIIFTVMMMVLVSGCTKETLPKNNTETKEPTSIIAPSVKMNEKYYRGVLPYKSSPIGRMLNNIPTRLDTNHFEMGLIEYAKRFYDPSEYVFQEGQVLTMNEIEPIYKSKENEGFLYAVSEHDYLFENGKYGGIVLGLLVSSTYEVKTGDTKEIKYYTDEELEQKSIQIIEDLTSLIRKRKGLEEPSILFAVMKTEEKDVKLPGTFFIQGEVKGNSDRVENWEKVDEYYIFLPSVLSGLNDKDSDLVRGFNYFKKEVDTYLPNYAGVVGLAKKVNGDLVELTIQINTEFDSTVEVIQLTQFAISLIPEFFKGDVHLNMYINSINQPRAIYIRQSNGDDFMHIYRSTYQP